MAVNGMPPYRIFLLTEVHMTSEASAQAAELDLPIAAEHPPAIAAAPRAAASRRGLALLLAAGVVLAGTGAGTYYLRHVAPYEATDDAFIDGHVIAITPQVSGLVAAVHFDDNQTVHKGDLLVELDPTDYQVALNQSRGAEASAQGRLEQARAGVDTAASAVAEAVAAVHSAQATFENADRELKRQQGLEARARSQKDLDGAVANRKTAAAALERAQAQRQAAQAQVASAKANVIAADGDHQKAQADTRRAEVNLGYCRINAAADGRITTKAVDPGAYVTPANPLFQIVPTQMWVVANFKETQLKDMRPGQPVQLSVDAYPQLTLTGRVDSIQSGTGSRFSVIPAENATGNYVKVVQRVPVKIILDGPASSLLAPGMSVEPKVRVRS
jgi:membrane fusion protein (multidrug efflux system)